ncbi:MAG: bis(5'-nucleosyl)-tetraphosphatase (symmetrical) YqeK [bacterium]|jgi:predicted HD superfamily hydrolase involved in NAD metabolism
MAIEPEVYSLLTKDRWEHTQGVVDTALELRSRHYPVLDPERVKMSALLHDCGKDLPLAMLLKKASDFGIVLTSFDLLCPQVIHAPISAGLARYQFHVTDKDILQAIAYHTTGKPQMSDLAKLIFVADYIEPGRKYPGVDALRIKARSDLDVALLACIDQTLHFLLQQGSFIHPRMVRTRNYYLLHGNKSTKI